MKKTLIRMLSLVLCAAMLCGMLAMTASAAEKRSNEVITMVETNISDKASNAIGTDEYGQKYFTTFQDLKTLVSKSYDEYTYYVYDGGGPLTITESITIPLGLDIETYELIVPAGVTVTVNGHLGGSHVTVDGTVVSNYVFYAFDSMTINGSVINNAEVTLFGGVDTVLTGEQNITCSDSGAIYRTTYMENTEDFVKACRAASAETNPNVLYPMILSGDQEVEITLDSDISTADLLYFVIEAPLTIHVAEGAVLELGCKGYTECYAPLTIYGDVVNNGYVTICAPVTIEGDMVNNYSLDIIYYNNGRLALNGTYADNAVGSIFVDAGDGSIPEDALTGVNIYDFAHEEKQHDGMHYQTLYSYFDSDVAPAPGASVPLFRMYDPNSGEHVYSGSTLEREFLINAGWHYEGVGFNFPEEGEPVYRLYEPVYGEHLYTMDEAEVQKLEGWGWKVEGVAFNSAGEDEVPQYRLHNPNAKRGGYHFTGSVEERDYLISIGWIDEGIGWYSCAE